MIKRLWLLGWKDALLAMFALLFCTFIVLPGLFCIFLGCVLYSRVTEKNPKERLRIRHFRDLLNFPGDIAAKTAAIYSSGPYF